MSGKHWTTEPDGYLEPKIGSSGAAADPANTIIDVFRNTVARHGDRPALCQKKKSADGVLPAEWKVWTYNDYWEGSRKFAKSLIHLGVSQFKIINILGFNSPEWFIANCGSIVAGCIAAGIYSTNTPEACKYISEHSNAEVVVLEGNKQLKKYAEIASSLPNLKAIVVWDEEPDADLSRQCGRPVYSWDHFLHLGEAQGVPEDAFETRIANVKPGNCSTLIYTSGTTGPPKAVMISHDNVTWTTKQVFDTVVEVNHTERIISYLPLSHIAAQIIDLHGPMYIGAATYFAQPDALKGSLSETMKDVRPTFFFGVPRVWEKIQEAMVNIGRKSTGVKKYLSTLAKKIGAQHSAMQQYGAGGGKPCCYGCVNAVILSKIKEALGLDQAKGCFSAAAPIAPETVGYFASLDIPVYEVFGQSECTGPHTISMEGAWKVGYCGRPIPGSESILFPGTGELCYRGRHIFMGYMYMPDKTAETIDENGYLHSGDIGEFDGNDVPGIPAPSGFLRITGRIKELIITAGGENIPPVLIENEMKAEMPALSNCMVVGDKRKFLGMLVSLKTKVDKESGEPTDELAPDALHVGAQIGSTATTLSDAAKDPLWRKYIDDGAKRANSRTTSNAQIVQKWKMLPVDFSEKAGELTPTLKLKRNVAAAKYEALIDSIYEGAGDA